MDDEDRAVAAITAGVCVSGLQTLSFRTEVPDLLRSTTDARRRRFEELADVEIRVPLFDRDRGRG
jgi:hypothetical protein